MTTLEPPIPEVHKSESFDLETVNLETLGATFKALADPARLKILRHLAFQGERQCCDSEKSICACDFETLTGLSQPTVSHHMKALINANLVVGEKYGKWMYYRINPDGFETLRRVLTYISS